MGENTTISWVGPDGKTWSPWIGCTKVSPACDGCYAAHLMDTRLGRVEWGPHGERKRTSDAYWRNLAKWNREAKAAGRIITVFPSLCDPWDNAADPGIRREWFAVARETPHLLYLLLSKRPQNAVAMAEAAGGLPPNAALGTTVEDQKRAINLFHLAAAARDTKPAFTFASFEPLLGPVDPTRIVLHEGPAEFFDEPEIKNARIVFDALRGAASLQLPPLGWAITGGETDQGSHKARPTHPAWFHQIRDVCEAAGVPYHHKQNGEWAPEAMACVELWPVTARHTWPAEASHLGLPAAAVRVGKKAAGRLLDGRLHDARPEVCRAG